MNKTTEIPKGERIARILTHMIRNHDKYFTTQEIMEYLSSRAGIVSLRNVQRDLKLLGGIQSCPVEAKYRGGKLYWWVSKHYIRSLS